MSFLARIDRAAFAAALGRLLRPQGIPVGLGELSSLTRALEAVRLTRRELYWAARITLIRHPAHLPAFDRVFALVFEDAVLAVDPHARRTPAAQPAPGRSEGWATPPGAGRAPRSRPAEDARDLPWITRPAPVSMVPDDENHRRTGELLLAEPLPSAAEGLADVPFADLDPGQLAQLSAWLETALRDWPSRPTRRHRPHPRGRRIDLRATLARSRATGFEPVRLARSRPARARRPLVMLCDVSRSMQPYTQVYVHLMRAAAVTVSAEVFAFSTDITRLTPALGLRGDPSGRAAILAAAQRVSGISPGTRVGWSVRRYLASRHGRTARGAIVLIASDGWDADDPAELAAAMARLRRRARRVIWINPRAGTPGFAPLAGAMAAALPHCDELLPGHTLRALEDVVTAIGRAR